jgi:hypothetical protein
MPIGRRRVRRSRAFRNSLPSLVPHGPADDSCGCSMGAKFLAAGLILSTLWYVWRGRGYGLSIGGIAARILLWSFLAACMGKSLGIALYRLRRRREGLRTSRSLP